MVRSHVRSVSVRYELLQIAAIQGIVKLFVAIEYVTIINVQIARLSFHFAARDEFLKLLNFSAVLEPFGLQ